MDYPPSFNVIDKTLELPVVFSIPHGGTTIPERFQSGLTASPESLWSDWFTTDLYDFVAEMDASMLSTDLSRFVADVNRDPDKPLLAPFQRGIVSTTDQRGNAIYAVQPSSAELEERLAQGYKPYHDLLDELVKSAVQHHGKAVVLDLHSFGRPLPVDIVIGDGFGTTATSETVRILEDAFDAIGLSSTRNVQFSGGWIVRKFKGKPLVEAVQIELNQRRYLRNEDADNAVAPPRSDQARYANTRVILQKAFQEILTKFSS